MSFNDFKTIKRLRTGDQRDRISPEMALAAAISHEAHVITTVNDNFSTNEIEVAVEVYGVLFWQASYTRSVLLSMPEEYLRNEVHEVCEKAYRWFVNWVDWDNYWEVPNEDLHAVEV